MLLPGDAHSIIAAWALADFRGPPATALVSQLLTSVVASKFLPALVPVACQQGPLLLSSVAVARVFPLMSQGGLFFFGASSWSLARNTSLLCAGRAE